MNISSYTFRRYHECRKYSLKAASLLEIQQIIHMSKSAPPDLMTIRMACIMYGDPPFNLLVCKSLVYIDLTQASLNMQIIIYGEDNMCNILDMHGQ